MTLLLLSSCGFHLRGFTEVPSWLTQVAITLNTPNRDLEPMLEEQLKAYHVRLASSPTNALYILTIERDNLERQITNVSASTTPRQYLLIYSVQFSLLDNRGVVVVPSTTISVTRQFTLNNNRILGSNYEEMTFKKEMEREAAGQIINRISVAQKPVIIQKRAKQDETVHRAA